MPVFLILIGDLGMTKKLVEVGTIKKGSYIIFDNAACRVTDVAVSRPGKHGHAKCRIEAVGLLDDKKRVEVMPGHDHVEVPIIEKHNAQVLSVSGDIANVMDSETYENFELKIPEELKGQISDGMVVLYWDVLGEKVLKQIKPNEG